MLGTTANAMANMEALVERYGPAPRAFLVVPMVGAFFIDFTNALMITVFLNSTGDSHDERRRFRVNAAWALLTDYTKGESLRKHALAVEAAVRGYARQFGEDEDAWGVVALLHDFDYERCPDLGEPSVPGAEILRAQGYPGVGDARDPLARRLHRRAARVAAREDAVRLRRDGGLRHRRVAGAAVKSVLDLEASSVIKRMKDKAFARAVNARRPAARAPSELGLPLDEHIANVIALHARARPTRSGLRGTL